MSDDKPVDYNQFWSDLRSGAFASMIRESAHGQTICNAAELYNVMKPLYAVEPDIEKVYGIFLDAKNHVVAIECLFQGSITSSMVYPREIIKKILSHQAAAIVISHNHPSGDPAPSSDDMNITFRIMLAVMSIGVTMHDHFILGRDRWYSMADQGKITQIKSRIESIIDM